MFNHITGEKLREFRLQSGLSIATAADAVSVTPAFISMVENGKCGISFQKIHSLVTLYGKTLSDLTTVSSSESRIINLTSAPEVASEAGVKIFRLAKGECPYYLGGFRMCFEPGAQHTPDHHEGMEYVLILEGTFDLLIHPLPDGHAELRHLKKGDTTTYSSACPHSFKNTSDKFATLFVIEIDKNEACPTC